MGIGAAIGSALIGASSASKAAKAQKNAADQQLALDTRIYDEQSANFKPYLEGGNLADQAYLYELGLGAAPTIGGQALDVVEFTDQVANPNGGNMVYGGGRGYEPYRAQRFNDVTRYRVGDQVFGTREAADAYAQANKTGGTEYGGYTKTPGYDFRLKQGTNAIESSAAARGGLNSGSTLKALNRYGQDYATGEYNNYLNRLAGKSASGQNAAGQQAAAGQQFTANSGNALQQYGNAAAAGAIGVGNSLQNGLSNWVGLNQYQKSLSGQNNSGSWWKA